MLLYTYSQNLFTLNVSVFTPFSVPVPILPFIPESLIFRSKSTSHFRFSSSLFHCLVDLRFSSFGPGPDSCGHSNGHSVLPFAVVPARFLQQGKSLYPPYLWRHPSLPGISRPRLHFVLHPLLPFVSSCPLSWVQSSGRGRHGPPGPRRPTPNPLSFLFSTSSRSGSVRRRPSDVSTDRECIGDHCRTVLCVRFRDLQF